MTSIFAVGINHGWFPEEKEEFFKGVEPFQTFVREAASGIDIFCQSKRMSDTKSGQTEKKIGNREGIYATRVVPGGLVRWHWPWRFNNWLGMTESREPASLLMMRSWDWGAGDQPVSHDLGSSIKVARGINQN